MNQKGVLTDLGLLILRVVLGATFIIHGWDLLYVGGQFGISEGFVKTLTDLQVPSPTVSAWLAALSEFGGGILLVAGFLPRIAALAIAGVMIVAIIKVHWQHGFQMNHFLVQGKGHGYEFALNLLAGALMILCAGAGKFSIMGILGGGKKEEGGGKPGKEEG
ncbi:MAG: DoxX family protein [Planctomycetes bacterium]|nr:DoxX family protein [Planctomycetota bacterium]